MPKTIATFKQEKGGEPNSTLTLTDKTLSLRPSYSSWDKFKLSLSALKRKLEALTIGKEKEVDGLLKYNRRYMDGSPNAWEGSGTWLKITNGGRLSIGCVKFGPEKSAQIFKAAGFSLAKARRKSKAKSR